MAANDDDVIIKVENKCFKSKRSVLAAESEYFSAMFQGNFKEGGTNRDEPIVLHDIDAAVFELIFNFIHGRIDVIPDTFTDLEALLRMIVFFGLRRMSIMEEKCVEYIRNYVWKRNPMPKVLELFTFACSMNKTID